MSAPLFNSPQHPQIRFDEVLISVVVINIINGIRYLFCTIIDKVFERSFYFFIVTINKY